MVTLGEARGKSLRRRLQDMPTTPTRRVRLCYVSLPLHFLSTNRRLRISHVAIRQRPQPAEQATSLCSPIPHFSPKELLHFCTAQYTTVPHSPPRKHERTFCCMRVASIQPPSCWLCYSPSPSRPFAAPNHESTAPLPFTGRRRSDLQSLPSTHLFRRMRTTPAMRPAKARTPR